MNQHFLVSTNVSSHERNVFERGFSRFLSRLDQQLPSGFAGPSECPAYPTELVFGLDMSDDVSAAAFETQRSALLDLLEGISIAESNCPSGARVAVVGFNQRSTRLIRFQDYHRKSQLIDAVKNVAPEKTKNKRFLGAAMRFVGQNLFKRVRAGVMVRKVAVFFSSGPTQDAKDVLTAVMEYRGLNIVPVVISLSDAPAVRAAVEVRAMAVSRRQTQGHAPETGVLWKREQVLCDADVRVTPTFLSPRTGL